MKETGITPKVCPKCGAGFNCYRSASMKCWCEDFTIKPENLNVLAEKYNNCLCPDCLAHYGEKKK